MRPLPQARSPADKAFAEVILRRLSAVLLFALPACSPTIDASTDGEEPKTVTGAMVLGDALPSSDTMALARPGDIYAYNDKVQVVIQGAGRHIGVNPYGGNLIDADVIRDDGSFHDALSELGFFVNLAGTGEVSNIEIDTVAGGATTITVTSDYVINDYFNLETGIEILLPGALDEVDVNQAWPIEFTTEYVLEPGNEFVHIRNTATNLGSEEVPYFLVWLADGGAVSPFIPTKEGFKLEQFGAAEYLVLEGVNQSYGLLPVNEERIEGRAFVSIVGAYSLAQEGTVVEVLTYPDSAPSVDPGDSLTFEALFFIGESHADVSRGIYHALDIDCVDITGTVIQEGGSVPIAGAAVTAMSVDEGADGADIAKDISNENGEFSMCLPPGPVRFVAGAKGRPYHGLEGEPGRVAFTVEEDAIAALTLPSTGHFTASIVDSSGSPLPSRVTILGVDPSPHTFRLEGVFHDPLAPGVAAVADSIDGTFAFDLEPGEYDAVFTHGPEFDLARMQIEVEGDNTTHVDATLHHVVDTTGYLTGDFHVHATLSSDSAIRNEDRVANMVAEDVQMLISTDHDMITDYWPTIDALNVRDRITTAPGQEITTFDFGHFNGFPLPIDRASPNNGALDWGSLSPEQIGDAVLVNDDAIFQLNHPRAVPAPGATGNYFNVIDLQFDEIGPFAGSDSVDPTAIRLPLGTDLLTTHFGAMEVMTWLNVQGLHDWYNFLNAGIVFTATGNSDTHTLAVESSGWPRNYVRMGHDDPTAVTHADLVAALLGGRNTVGFGPFVELSAQSGGGFAEIGDQIELDGEVTVTARVQAPDWVPFDRVTLYEGATGTEIGGGAVVPVLIDADGGQRLEITVEATFTPDNDTWLVAVVGGSDSLYPGIVYNAHDPDLVTLEAIRDGTLDGTVTAFAVTNPIWVDADGDGDITPSHLVLDPDFEQYRAEDRTRPY